MKIYYCKYFYKLLSFFTFIISLIILKVDVLNAEESYLNLEEMEINSSTKTDENSLDLPNNPFEIVEMIRRANSMNDATKPSDALDDALNSFNMIEENEKI